tara:strand:- start:3303 stop:4265 length:963 start_codon:yes stop_codon:yes gene_type:complete
MKRFALLISPRAKSAYFNDYIDVAKAELAWSLPDHDVEYVKIAEMDFLRLTAAEEQLPMLARLSCVHGIFEQTGDEGCEQLLPLATSNNFDLDEDFIFGAKFKGKTNETLTQMLINVGLASIKYDDISKVKLLDPMCGRATTLLWAMRYGMSSKGIEQDSKALPEIRQNVKKWCKVHKQKHQFRDGFVGGKAGKQSKGKFLDFTANDATMRIITGDSIETSSILKGDKFDLLVTDIPYGVQHFTTSKTRNPLAVLEECAKGWSDVLKKGGVIVIAFNSNIPKRRDLIAAFSDCELQVLDFSAQHRMSESIVRDVVMLRKI